MSEYAVSFQNQPVDVSEEFAKQESHFFLGSRVDEFDQRSATGKIVWKSMALKQRVSYHQVTLPLEDYRMWRDVPPEEYQDDRDLPFSISFITPKTVRLRLAARPEMINYEPFSLMLDGEPGTDNSWEMSDSESSTTYESQFGSLTVTHDPWHLEFRDASGRFLTRTHHLSDAKGVINSAPIPFSFIRTSSNLHRLMAASFELSPNEMLFGCGESFTSLNKRGQKLVMWTYDAYGAQSPYMYKPVPFFMSSRGYGIYLHTSAPSTFDLGHSHDGANVIYLGDDYLDLFFFFGTPKEILSEYTALTGRANMMPLWSFGLWMGRDTYSSEDEVRDVAKKLRQYEIPCDVVHIDTGWFETPHRCDFEFSKTRFPDPAKMISDLKNQGLHLSLWQLPYFNPKNKLHDEAIDRGYVVLSANGKPPIDDAVLDFSNEEAEIWYQQKLRRLLEMGVGVIVADFGEAAPLAGLYAHREGAFYEHNLYPLRYNKAVADISREVTGESIMWARSAWAGCQRYPLHWGGDPENTDGGMAGTLRGGLSLGLCGFSFWSHFIGGFPHESPEGLYGRWLAFGVFSAHSRCHGRTPREPWEFGEEFTDEFRRTVELRYRLMPYVYAQAKLCSEEGYPMMRTLFFDYPEDGASWFIEDEYMFGRDLLVAPLMEDTTTRDVYLPPGRWIDYQSSKAYQGAGWHRMRAGEVPVVMLVKDGTAIPHIGLAQSTTEMDWREIELVVFSVETSAAEGLLCLPEEGQLHALRLERDGEAGGFVLTEDPLQRRVDWRIRIVPAGS